MFALTYKKSDFQKFFSFKKKEMKNILYII